MKYRHRLAEERFIKLNKIFKVVLVNGARQVGKTSMLKKLSKNSVRTYVTLDDINIRELAIKEPKMFFKKYDLPILIDEVQYAKNIFNEIKVIVDKDNKNGNIWITGSQNYAIMKNVTESLAGRIGIMNLFSFHKSEIYDKYINEIEDFSFDEMKKIYNKNIIPNFKELFNDIIKGGMPYTVELQEDERKEYINSYIESYLMRDVVEIGKVQDLYKFRKFLSAITVFAGEQINYKKIADSADISQPTAKEWVYILEGLGIIFLLRPYTNNKLKRLTKSPKLYFMDTGILSYLSRKDKSLADSSDSGRFFENYVISEFIKKYQTNNPSAEFYYYRDSNMNEIDLIYLDGDEVHPFEIKLSANPDMKIIKRFDVLKINSKVSNGGIICLSDDLLPINDTNCVIPYTLF